jgi:hypothetical protein
MLTHFYGYLYFADMNIHNFYKRFVRDRMRYLDSIFCLAGRVINAMQTEAKHAHNKLPAYHAYHIRRGDFQHKNTRLPAEEV